MRKYLIFTAILSFIAVNSVEAKRGHGGDKAGFGMHMFDQIDTNDDNKVSLAEHNAFHSEKFTEMDTDKNSEISLEEMMNFKRAKKEERQARKQNK